MKDIDVQLMSRFLNYNPDTGVFSWGTPNVEDFKTKAAYKAWVTRSLKSTPGVEHNAGYLAIIIRGSSYLAHRIAWAMFHGDTKKEIDHINGDKKDNRISNLRVVNKQENQRNSKIPKNNKSGVVGVRRYRDGIRWLSFICIDGKQKHIGIFESIDLAKEARRKAEFEYGFHPNHGNRRQQ